MVVPDSTAAPSAQTDSDLEMDSAIRQARETLDLFVEKPKTPIRTGRFLRLDLACSRHVVQRMTPKERERFLVTLDYTIEG